MNKKEGFTLVEVLVSMTIFLIVFISIIASITIVINRVGRYEEYEYLENICLDIDKIYDNEGYEGLVRYYSFESLVDDSSSGELYIDSTYKFSKSDYKYILSYKYTKDESDVSFIISIKNDKNNYYIIENLEYGHSKYDDSINNNDSGGNSDEQ